MNRVSPAIAANNNNLDDVESLDDGPYQNKSGQLMLGN